MAYWFIFNGGDIMLQKLDDGTYTIPQGDNAPLPIKADTHVLNVSPMDNGTEVKAFRIDKPVNEANFEMCGLRQSFYKLSQELYLKAGKCNELLYWDRNTQFCGVCGSPMNMDTGISKRCTYVKSYL